MNDYSQKAAGRKGRIKHNELADGGMLKLASFA